MADPATAQKFQYWQTRILVSSLLGYAAFYFVRKNLGTAMPAMEKGLHISKEQLGAFLSLHGVLYGLSKFFHGFVADRTNARVMMVVGLVLCAVTTIFFGMSSAVLTLGILWVCNGWFQGVGFPPCARLMTHWFSPKELATKMSIWNTSHSIGAALIAILCGQLLARYGDWRLCFWVPGVIVLLMAVLLWIGLRDTPASLGLPEVAGTEAKPTEDLKSESYKEIVRRKVFGNPYVWAIAVANFFVYTVRYTFFDWGTTFLKESKGFDIAASSMMTGSFELCGVLGMLLTGWMTDRFFGGRGARVCFLSMLLVTATVYIFWRLPANALGLNTLAFGCLGFFIYGPQALVGIAVANLATKRAAASAVGLTGIFGYASTVISGWGVGKLAHTYGWNMTFKTMIGMSLLGAIFFAVAWPSRATGYDD